MNDFEFFYTFYPDHNGIICSDEKCGRLIQYLDKCFIDTNLNTVYCEACGLCIRYERKMEKKRQLNKG